MVLKALRAFAESLSLTPVQQCPPGCAEPFPQHVAVSECPAWLTQGRAALPPRQSSPCSPSELRAPGICLHTALTSSQHRQRLLPLLRAGEKGAIPASAVTRMTRAHIGNSIVPGSRCDLPVAHLLASVKCKSLRASVSAQYSQEH